MFEIRTKSFFLVSVIFLIASNLNCGGERPTVILCDLFAQADTAEAWEELKRTSTQAAGSGWGALWSWSTTAASSFCSSLLAGENPLLIQKHLEERLFEVLHQVPGDHMPGEELAHYQGRPLPPIFCAFLKGQEPEGGALAVVQKYIDAADGISATEGPVLKTLVAIMFSPEKTARLLTPVPTVVRLLTQCRAQSPDVRFVLSANNRDLAPFAAQEKFAEYMALFSPEAGGAELLSCCPGTVGHLKPTAEYFLAEQEMIGYDRARAVRLELELTHAQAAREQGYRVVHWPADQLEDPAPIQEELERLGILRRDT